MSFNLIIIAFFRQTAQCLAFIKKVTYTPLDKSRKAFLELRRLKALLKRALEELNFHLMSDQAPPETSQNPLVAYVVSAFEEFGKVTWPTKEQATLLTGIVVAVSFVLVVLLGLFDFGLSELYREALKQFSS